MKHKITPMNQGAPINRMAGILLLDVVLGIVIFVVGMLALAHLQGNLTRSSADANTRTVATHVAEEIIETARAFEQVPTDPFDIITSYGDIETETRTVTRGGIEYTVNITIVDYYYDVDTESFTDIAPSQGGTEFIVYSDFKYMEVEVVWNTSQQFQISEGLETGDLLSSGSITLTDIISSMPTFSSAKVAANSGDQQFYFPEAEYTSGPRPDAASIDLGNYRYKQSTTPVSIIDTQEGINENWFDVVTYQQIDSDNAIFIRREEFLTVSCQCQIRAAVTDSGRRPTVWDGAAYTEGEFVTKTWGERPDDRKQSNFCDHCCRDHHDGGSTASLDQAPDPGRSLYNPFKSSSDDYYESGTFVGDHKHYARDDTGNLVAVNSVGDLYLEACRLVRKDGFFRVTQDFRQEGLFAFPQDYLESVSDQSEYSAYVGEAATTFVDAAIAATGSYESNLPVLLAPGAALPAVVFPASTSSNPTSLPNVAGGPSQQLNSRGIYIDYLSDDLRDVVECLDGESLSALECGAADNVFTSIEVIPFFDVQLTWLTRWNETPINTPVDVTNENILTDNAHSRGVATLESGGSGMSEVETDIHKGNLGFTGTDPIIPDDFSEFTDYGLYISSSSNISPATPDKVVISGSFLSGDNALAFNMADLVLTGSQARCGQTNSGYSCAIEAGATYPTVTISDYDVTQGNSKVGCSGTLIVDAYDRDWTRFVLPTVTTPGADIVMVPGSTCPAL